jgi:hypothetical protein
MAKFAILNVYRFSGIAVYKPYNSLWMEETICISGALVLIIATSVLTNRGIVLWIRAWSTDSQLQLDEGGENS